MGHYIRIYQSFLLWMLKRCLITASNLLIKMDIFSGEDNG